MKKHKIRLVIHFLYKLCRFWTGFVDVLPNKHDLGMLVSFSDQCFCVSHCNYLARRYAHSTYIVFLHNVLNATAVKDSSVYYVLSAE
jgi:hypothetical protein